MAKICIGCGAKDGYRFRSETRTYTGYGQVFSLVVRIPVCKKCGMYIFDEETEERIAEKAKKNAEKKANRIRDSGGANSPIKKKYRFSA